MGHLVKRKKKNKWDLPVMLARVNMTSSRKNKQAANEPLYYLSFHLEYVLENVPQKHGKHKPSHYL